MARTAKPGQARSRTSAVKKAAAKKKAPAKKKAAAKKKAPAKKAPAKKKAAAKKAPAKKAPAKKAPAKKAPAKKAPAKKKAAAKKAPAKKAPAKKKAPRARTAALDKFFDAQRKSLLEERETYTRQAESLRAEAELLAQEAEPGDTQFDEESGEGDTINVERARDLALSAQARAAVEEIDKALLKIEDGTYGICAQCQDPIPRERLRALPYASLCVRCKSGGLGRR